ncbi:hypothetical protein GCG54_00010911 [Colletotrichum gloeosporioides]|uniref:Uncharacterized protein n=1 Tax=Colletotrichum gloeosporioides TaxID=474922 RepID=A0A8H4CRY5_COLGL|nr:uncharacterized protein GCG54_00010911 [Colletotrichum gloeosporioides]KAF3808722.1 hypothetical protein GCG54_00010911 [Colletotrichum gloeosporioides]
MPPPSVLAQCSSTLWCIIRSLPLWTVVLVVLLLGAARQLVFPSIKSADKKRAPPPSPQPHRKTP